MSDIRDKPERTDDSGRPRGPSPAAPGVIDEWVAFNVRLHRENRGWSQADLAEKMAALGWKYHPQTVHRIESGQRKVTVGEAEALARMFNTTVDSLTWPDRATHTSAWLGLFTGRSDAAFEQIAGQTRELLFDREHIERALAEIARLGTGEDELVGEAISDAQSVLENATPEQAVEEGRERYEEWRAGTSDDAWNIFSGRLPDRLPRAPWIEAQGGEGTARERAAKAGADDTPAVGDDAVSAAIMAQSGKPLAVRQRELAQWHALGHTAGSDSEGKAS